MSKNLYENFNFQVSTTYRLKMRGKLNLSFNRVSTLFAKLK